MDEAISTADMLLLTGMTRQRLTDMVSRGIIPRSGKGQFPHPSAIRSYIEHLERVAAGRGGEAGGLELTAERARLAKEQADGQAIKNAVQRGELIEASLVERRWSDILSGLRAKMLAVPTDVSQTLPHLTRFDIDSIDRVIRDALTEVAES